MTEAELAAELRRMYRDAPRGEKSTAVALFGIYYAAELAPSSVSVNLVAELAGLPKWNAEIRKGMRLARYVDLNNRIATYGLG